MLDSYNFNSKSKSKRQEERSTGHQAQRAAVQLWLINLSGCWLMRAKTYGRKRTGAAAAAGHNTDQPTLYL